ncbi:hypothetical protein WA026_001195 [Henosepilachna vigintioctopunctata]|uniref:Uncharacterized protein n=1 Tax=Henosepilachna vigintioctopunctata TaxID=420089 RepID=A0AAW1UQF0_9CUCU
MLPLEHDLQLKYALLEFVSARSRVRASYWNPYQTPRNNLLFLRGGGKSVAASGNSSSFLDGPCEISLHGTLRLPGARAFSTRRRRFSTRENRDVSGACRIFDSFSRNVKEENGW